MKIKSAFITGGTVSVPVLKFVVGAKPPEL